MNAKEVGYPESLKRRQGLAASLVRLAGALTTLDAKERAKALLDAKVNLETDDFRVMIAGEFKRGKSTLINAMLGQSILPAKVAPCTAVITRVAYGEHPKAVLHFKDESKKPLSISVEDLVKYVVINESADEEDEDKQSEAVNSSPYEKVEVFYPLPLCRNGVEIVDSPGLNEQKTRTRISLDFLSRADALVVVLSCQQALSHTELEFIDRELKGRDLRHVFFIFNHFDIIADSPDDIEDIKKRSRKYLEPKAGSTNRIFFLSAKSALVGRKNNRPDDVRRSQLPEFEQALERFLVEERGRVKLTNPLRAAEAAVRDALNEIIPTKVNMLTQPLDELRARYEQQKPRLQEAVEQRERILRSIERRREALIREAEASYQNLVTELEEGARKLIQKVDVGWWEIIKSKSEAKEKLAKPVDEWFRQRISEWQENELAKLFDYHLKDLQSDLNEQANVFETNLNAVRAALTPDVKITTSEEEVSGLSRVLGAAGGFFIGGIGSAIEGGAGGFGVMLKGLPTQMAIGLTLVVLGFGLPVILPALAATGIIKGLLGGKSKADQLRESTANTIVTELRKNTPGVVTAIRSQIGDRFQELLSSVDSATKIMIDEVKGQIQTILKERQESETAVERQLANIKNVRENLLMEQKAIETMRRELDPV